MTKHGTNRDTFVPSATDASAASHEAAYTAAAAGASGQETAVYTYTDPQGISYPAYGQAADGSAVTGVQYPAYNSSAYNNSYNQAVNDYASAALSYGYSASSASTAPSSATYTQYQQSQYQSKTRPVYSNNQVIRRCWPNDNSGPRPQRPDQQVYCDVCKISCVSQQAFDAHLKGQQHQKKVKIASGSSGNGDPKVGNQLLNPVLMMCTLCEVPCSGSEAYAAHMRGSKHQKVLTLHQRMGKPIPNMAPVPATTPADTSAGALRVMGTPTMNFKEGGCLSTTDNKNGANGSAESGTVDQTEADIAAIRSLDQVIAQAKNSSGTTSSSSTPAVLRRPEPIGEEQVVSVSPRDGKPASFYCKICECAIGDATARDQHLRGKRHRYSYKQKVDPRVEAEVFPKPRPEAADRAVKPVSSASPAPTISKPVTQSSGSTGVRPVRPVQRTGSTYQPRNPGHGGNNWGYSGYSQNYGWSSPNARQAMPRYRPPTSGYMPRYPPHHSYSPMAPGYGNRQPFPRLPGPMHGYRQPGYGYQPTLPAAHYPHRPQVRPFRGPPAAPELVHHQDPGPSDQNMFPIPLTEDDHLILKKHSLISPSAEELDFVFKLLDRVEEALKLVSDDLMVTPADANMDEVEIKVPTRVLKGLMRVGPAAEQLLLATDDETDVVVMCADKPTKLLQKRVMERLPVNLAKLCDSSHVTVGLEEDEYTIRVTDVMPGKGKRWSVRISLTSPLMRSVNVIQSILTQGE